MSNSSCKQKTPGTPEVLDFPRHNISAIDSCMRRPKDPPLFDPKGEMQLELCVKPGTTLIPTFPLTDSQLPL